MSLDQWIGLIGGIVGFLGGLVAVLASVPVFGEWWNRRNNRKMDNIYNAWLESLLRELAKHDRSVVKTPEESDWTWIPRAIGEGKLRFYGNGDIGLPK